MTDESRISERLQWIFPASIENHKEKKKGEIKRENTSLVSMKRENYGK